MQPNAVDLILMWLEDRNTSKFWTINQKRSTDYDTIYMVREIEYKTPAINDSPLKIAVNITLPHNIEIWSVKLHDAYFFDKLQNMINSTISVEFSDLHRKITSNNLSLRGMYVE
jgi:hypothetical protein